MAPSGNLKKLNRDGLSFLGHLPNLTAEIRTKLGLEDAKVKPKRGGAQSGQRKHY